MIPLLLLLTGCGLSPEVVAKGMGSANPAVREDMVAAGKLVDDPAVVEALHGALGDPSVVIRLEAVKSLAELGHAESAEPLVLLLNDRSEEVRAATVTALARVGDPAAVEPLIAHARSGGLIRLDAIWALGVLKDGRAVPLLSELRESEDAYVAWNADRALREIGDAPSGAGATGEEATGEEATGEGAAGEAGAVEPSANPEPAQGADEGDSGAPEEAEEAEDAAPTQMTWPGMGAKKKEEEPPPVAPPTKKVAWPGGG